MSYEPKEWVTGESLEPVDFNHIEEGVAEMTAYDPHTWTAGELLTADKMNHIEEGIASCGLYLPIKITIKNQTSYQIAITHPIVQDDNLIMTTSLLKAYDTTTIRSGDKVVCNLHPTTSAYKIDLSGHVNLGSYTYEGGHAFYAYDDGSHTSDAYVSIIQGIS